MPFPLAIPLALSVIQALIKFRGRLDTILSLNRTTEGLPFALPPAPQFDAPHIDPMIEFFNGDVGKGVLEIRGLAQEWSIVQPDPRLREVQAELGKLLQAYYEATDTTPEMLGPDPASNRQIVSRGPSKEMRLAYWVVESDRLSRNPAVTRVLLAAADTLLEFGADNASLFVSDPRTRGLVETLLREFAVERDWDDASGEVIFRTLLGAAAVAALEHRGSLPDQPILQVLFGALGDVQKELGAEFVAKLVTKDGFLKLVGLFLVQAADQPGLLPGEPVLQESLAAMLRVAGENLDGILGDPKTIAGVLEAGIAAAAGAGVTVIDKQLGDKPLLAVVLKAVAGEFKNAGDQRVLFRRIGDGVLFTALYRTGLRSVAANPEALVSQAKLDKHVASLISAFADELSHRKPIDALSADTVRAIAVRSLEVVGRDPAFLAAHGEFAAKVVGAALTAIAGALKDGLTTDDLLDIAEETLLVASTNLNLVAMDDHLRTALEAIGATLGDKCLTSLTTGRGRKELFFAGLESISTNPQVWQGFAEKNIVEPLVAEVIRAFATNPGNLLAGAALVPAFLQVLKAAANRGRALLAGETTPAALGSVIAAALSAAETQIGASIDGETLPSFLRRVVLAFLAAPFDPATNPDLAIWLKAQLLVAG